MCEYTESYPTVCIGQILTYPLYGGLQDCGWRAFDIHSGNQSSRLVCLGVVSAKRSHRDICNSSTRDSD